VQRRACRRRRARGRQRGHLSAERLLMIYGNQGLAGVRAELSKLRARHLI
jgi:hypothetical protein